MTEKSVKEITTSVMCTLTGATNRQIDFWVTNKLVVPVGAANPGNGRRRFFYMTDVEPVKLLVNLSKSFSGNIPLDLMKNIYDSYDEGKYDLGNGVYINWET